MKLVTILLNLSCILSLVVGAISDCESVGYLSSEAIESRSRELGPSSSFSSCLVDCESLGFSVFVLLEDQGCRCAHGHQLEKDPRKSPSGAGAFLVRFEDIQCHLSLKLDEQRHVQHGLCPDRKRIYCDPEKDLNLRVSNFIAYMTTEDRIRTMGQDSIPGKYWDNSDLVARNYSWWNEALHGLWPHLNDFCGEVCPTQFGEANSLSCSWNESLWFATAEAISIEARAYYNEKGNHGLTFYAPQINLAAHPLWGRVMETPGEDPYLTSMFAIAYVTGLQGDHPRVLRAAATPKHFVGHFFEGDRADPFGNSTVVNRMSNDTRYTLQDLEQYYLVPFRAALKEAKAASLMCAYQSVNGVPVCANGFLLNQVVRKAWKWDGFVVSDCDAINTMTANEFAGVPFHAYSNGEVEAVHDGVHAGCDQNCGVPSVYFKYGMEAFNRSRITRKEIDVSLRRQLKTLFRLGLFDPIDQDPYSYLRWKHVGTRRHRRLALEGARQSIVLLKNGFRNRTNPILPFRRTHRILLTGPLFNATNDYLGNYHGRPCKTCILTLQDHLVRHNVSVESEIGVPSGCTQDMSGISAAAEAAAKPAIDVVIMILGGTCHEAEGRDREFLYLPGSQLDLFNAVYDVGKPMVVVIVNGGPYAIERVKESDVAIVQTGFPGQAGTRALAEVLLGKISPSGKLTTTIYPASYANGIPVSGTPYMSSFLRPSEESEGRTYMFYNGTPLFPFGYGLSYSSFNMTWEKEPATIWARREDVFLGNFDKLQFEIKVTNKGAMRAKEIVQAYWKPPSGVDFDLKKQLFDFQGVILDSGESSVLRFSAKKALKSLSTVTQFGDRVLRPGNYTILFSRGHGDTLEAEVCVTHYSMVRKFPSRFVDNHDLVLEACIEGTQEIVPHDEQFLVDYKQWEWMDSDSLLALRHKASKKCLTYNTFKRNVYLLTCKGPFHHQAWVDQGGILRPKSNMSLCLQSTAVSAEHLRHPAVLSEPNSSECTLWNLTEDSLLKSNVPRGQSPAAQDGLCLAASSVGQFNDKS